MALLYGLDRMDLLRRIGSCLPSLTIGAGWDWCGLMMGAACSFALIVAEDGQ